MPVMTDTPARAPQTAGSVERIANPRPTPARAQSQIQIFSRGRERPDRLGVPSSASRIS